MSIEKRVHPIPFRTRKLSASSPMILRIFTWESRPMPRLSLERLLFRSLSSFKGCSHRAALFCFRAGDFPAFFSGASCGLSAFVPLESMTVCRGPEVSRTQGKGKIRFSGLPCGRGGVDEAGLGSASFTCARALVCCMNDGCCLTTSLFPPVSERHRKNVVAARFSGLLEKALPGSSVFTVVR